MKKITLIINKTAAKKILELPVRNPITLSVSTANRILEKPKEK